jgi:PAS domain S-box-containing protein
MNAGSLSLLLAYASNAALVTVGLLVYAQLRDSFVREPDWFRQVVEGACFSLLIALTMAMPLQLPSGVRVDLRVALVCLSVIFGGPLCGLMASFAGLALRELLGGHNTPVGVALVVLPYVMSLFYRAWVDKRGRRVGYVDLVALGLLLDLLRLAVWLAIFGYQFTLHAMGLAWFGIMALVPGSVLVLGSAVLLVEERRELARSVADSEARFRSVVDQLPEGLTLVDLKDRYTYVNKAWQQLTGVASREALGKTRRELWRASGAPAGPFEIAERVVEGGETIRTEPQLLEIGGHRRWIVGTLFPVRDASGTLREIGTTGNEVTDLVRAREDLAQREAEARRHAQALLEAVRACRVVDRPVIETIHALTEIAGETIGADHTGVFRADYESRHSERLDLWVRGKAAHLPALIDTRTAIWDLAEKLDREGVRMMEDARSEPMMAARAEYLQEHDIRSLMVAPIFVDARFWGVISFSSIGEPRRWSAGDANFARSIADLLAQGVLTNRYRESLAALDLIDDGLYIEDPDGRVFYANRVAREMVPGGADDRQADLFGMPMIAVPRPPVPMSGDHDRQEMTLDGKDGRRDLVVERDRIPSGGRIVVIRDITERKAEQAEREKLEQQLRQASRLEALGQLAGGIAHDFNNLLGAVIGFARFLDEDLPPGSDQHQYAGRILAASERGKAIVAQILAFARVRNVERHALDFRALLAATEDLLRGVVGPHTRLRLDLPAASLPILGNEGQVTQLLVNLCANANDALDGKEGEVHIRLRHVALVAAEAAVDPTPLFDDKRPRHRLLGRLDPTRAYLRLDVCDTGKGIAPDALPHIFEPFFTTKHRQGGAGLGLAVVQSVIELYDGALYLDSREGGGTTFSVYLPLTDRPLAASEAQTERPEHEGRERVLVVDDDVDVGDMLAIGLERLGYEVIALNDPREALEAFRAAPGEWDVAVIDRVMPGMEGLALARALRAIRRELRIILCTGLDDGTIDPRSAGRPFDLFYRKPVAPEQVAAGIRRLLDQ